MTTTISPYGFPPTLIPSPNKFDVPTWTATHPNPNYAFTRVSARTLRTISWESFKHPYLIFGRDLTIVHVFVGHPAVSGQQAAVVWDRQDGRCYIKDLESANGTFINDKIVSNSRYEELLPGCRVRFGTSAELFIFDRIPGSTQSNQLPKPLPDDTPIPLPIPPQNNGRRTPPIRSPRTPRGRSRSPAIRRRSPHGGRQRMPKSPGPMRGSPGPIRGSPGSRRRGLGPGHGNRRENDDSIHGGRDWERPRERFDRRYDREFDDRRNQGRNSNEYNRRDYDRMRSPRKRNSRDGYH